MPEPNTIVRDRFNDVLNLGAVMNVYGGHRCPFSYGPAGAHKCHILVWTRPHNRTVEVKCPSAKYQEWRTPARGKPEAIPECPLRNGPVTIRAAVEEAHDA
jgi:hypothetical protein